MSDADDHGVPPSASRIGRLYDRLRGLPVVRTLPAAQPSVARRPGSTPGAPLRSPGASAARARATTTPEPAPGRPLTDDATPHAERTRLAIARLRDEHGWLLGGEDVRGLLHELERAPLDAVRQLPDTALRALAVCDDPGANSSVLIELCEQDPAVAAQLLRYANAPCYAPCGEAVSSLRLAVARVGVGGVRNVVIDVAVHGLLCDPGPGLAPLAAQVWQHLVGTAAVARAVARAFGLLPESAYTIGLLHDVGKLVLLDRLSALRVQHGRAPALPDGFLRAAFGVLHEPLGALALERWGLGDAAAAAVGAHHRLAPPATRDPLGEVVYLAERVDLARRRGRPLDLEGCWRDGALGGDLARATRALDEHFAD